jgi:CBS-domain-containing membrane protein
MKVRDMMTKEVYGCWPDSSLAAAAQIMWAKDCGALPVLEDDDSVVGMITDRDISIAIAMTPRRPSEITVGEVMSKPVCACGPEDHVKEALNWMANAQVRRLPVIDQHGGLQGILSISDVMACHWRSAGVEIPSVSCHDLVEAYGRISEPRPDAEDKRQKALAAIA